MNKILFYYYSSRVSKSLIPMFSLFCRQSQSKRKFIVANEGKIKFIVQHFDQVIVNFPRLYEPNNCLVWKSICFEIAEDLKRELVCRIFYRFILSSRTLFTAGETTIKSKHSAVVISYAATFENDAFFKKRTSSNINCIGLMCI